MNKKLETAAEKLSAKTGYPVADAVDALTLVEGDFEKAENILNIAKENSVEPFVVMAELIIEACEKEGTTIHF